MKKFILVMFSMALFCGCAMAQYPSVPQDSIDAWKARAYAKKITLDQFLISQQKPTSGGGGGSASTVTVANTVTVAAHNVTVANTATVTPASGSTFTTNVANTVTVAAHNVTVVGTVPLPSGAATSANQTTHNTKLDNIYSAVDALYAINQQIYAPTFAQAVVSGTTVALCSAAVTSWMGVNNPTYVASIDYLVITSSDIYAIIRYYP